MIIVKLEGGLGNQMFQYALGRNLSLIYGVPLKLDTSYLRQTNQSGRSFGLHHFNITAPEADRKEIAAYRSVPQKVLDRLRPRLLRKKILERSPDFDSNVATEQFEPRVLAISDGYFVGHWKNEKYFEENAGIIRHEFTLKEPFSPAAARVAKKIAGAGYPASVHIRRGDYVGVSKIAKVMRALPVSYYKEACDIVLKKSPDARFFVFSDDIAWAKENFPKTYDTEFVSAPDIADYEELALMSGCKANTIANSTFSWWAAWLNRHNDKTVIAPKQWFNDPRRDSPDLIPKTWIPL